MKRMNVTVSGDMLADLKKAARKRGATMSALVRIYISEGLKKDLGTAGDTYEVPIGGNRRAHDSE